MSEPRKIKKYPNRRLYDTVESRYITLADIRRLVIERIDFVVIDKKTQADITRSILLQVIAEQEHGEPLMSRDFLSQDPLLRPRRTQRHGELPRSESQAVHDTEHKSAHAGLTPRLPINPVRRRLASRGGFAPAGRPRAPSRESRRLP
jgi:polyhydroxyalkanoate synthesis repressor PhaR